LGWVAEHFQELTIRRGDRGCFLCTDAVGSENCMGMVKYIYIVEEEKYIRVAVSGYRWYTFNR